MNMDLSHKDCLELLADPSTENILKKLGHEYSDRGQSEYRKIRPNFVPALVKAITAELQHHQIFPPRYRDSLPQTGIYIRNQGDAFVLMNIDKPSVWTEYAFPTPEGAARGYVQMILDSYWLKPDHDSYKLPENVRLSWQPDSK
jgi:hypothetical protein